MNKELFNKVWNNIYLRNLILQFMILYDEGSTLIQVETRKELLQKPNRPFILNLSLGSLEDKVEHLNYIDYDDFGSSFINSGRAANFQEDDDISNDETIFNISEIPSSVESLFIGKFVDIKLFNRSIPSSIKKLSFYSNRFNRKLEIGHIPSSVTILSFKNSNYNQPLNKYSIPSSVTKLELSNDFNHQIKKDDIPSSVEYLSIGKAYSYGLLKDSIPPSVKTLKIYSLIKLDSDSIPSSVVNLKLGGYYNYKIPVGVIKPSVKKLSIGHYFRCEINPKEIPKGLEIIKLGFSFCHQLYPSTIPSTVKVLLFSSVFNKPIYEGDIGRGVKVLRMSENFNQPLIKDELPPRLLYLKFGNKWNQEASDIGIIPYGLKELVLGEEFNRSNTIQLPESIIKLTIPNNFNPKSIPTSVKTLQVIKWKETLGYIANSQNNVFKASLIPNSITKLSISPADYQIDDFSLIPASVTSLKLKSYSDLIKFDLLPKSITSLSIHYLHQTRKLYPDFNEILPNLPSSIKILRIINLKKTITSTSIPPSVTDLFISVKENQILPNTIPSSVVKLSLYNESEKQINIQANTIPKSVKELNINGNFTQPLSLDWIPSSVTQVTIPHDYSFTSSINSYPSTIKTINRNNPIIKKKSLNYLKILNKYNK